MFDECGPKNIICLYQLLHGRDLCVNVDRFSKTLRYHNNPTLLFFSTLGEELGLTRWGRINVVIVGFLYTIRVQARRLRDCFSSPHSAWRPEPARAPEVLRANPKSR